MVIEVAGVRRAGDRHRRLPALRGSNTLGRDVWVRATDIVPGDRTVVHHVIVGVYDPKIPDERMRMIKASSPSLGALCAGQRPDAVSAGHRRAGAQGSGFAFQVHYTTSGKAAAT